MSSSKVRAIIGQTKPLRLRSKRSLTTATDVRKASELAAADLQEQPQYGIVQESLFPPLELPNSDVFSYAFRNIAESQNNIYQQCSMTGRSYTFGQSYDGALRVSAALEKLLPNDPQPTVAILMPNSPEWPIIFYGILARGGIATTINPSYTPSEIAHHLKDSGASVLIVDSMVEPLADGALKVLGADMPVIVNGPSKSGRPNIMQLISDKNAPMAERKEIDPKQVGFLPYSSGTTGLPKGVKLSHAAITNNVKTFANNNICPWEDTCQFDEVHIAVLPYFHIYGILTNLLTPMEYRSKVITMPTFDPKLFIQTIKTCKLSVFMGVPALLQFIASTPLITKEDLSHLKSFVIGSAPVPYAAAQALRQKIPEKAMFQEGFGMTECLLTHVTPSSAEKIGYCGKVLPNSKSKIIDIETGAILGPHQKGELCVKSESLMDGYHNNPTETAQTIDKDGWLHTGDIAMYDEEGYFSVVDRIKELIKVKGLQVSPSELENVIMNHPSVADAGVIGLPDDKTGETPVAFVVAKDKSLKESDITEFMGKTLAKHKQVTKIHFVDQLPKNVTGKLLRRVLKQMGNDAN